ncbi:MAG: sigma-70 family RNA polymerase sigma factor [Propionicimonas sp.]
MPLASPHAEEPAPPAANRWQRSAEFFERWQAGDALAMDELVRLMTPVLWHVVRGCGLERTLAEDVVQHTWLTLVRQHDAISDSRAVAGWLLTTARREAWRVARQQNRADPTDTAEFDWRLPIKESTEDAVVRQQRDSALWRAVTQLTERCQQLLRVIAFDERPDYAGIARDLEIPVGSIGPTRLRCLAKLRTLLEEGQS